VWRRGITDHWALAREYDIYMEKTKRARKDREEKVVE